MLGLYLQLFLLFSMLSFLLKPDPVLLLVLPPCLLLPVMNQLLFRGLNHVFDQETLGLCDPEHLIVILRNFLTGLLGQLSGFREAVSSIKLSPNPAEKLQRLLQVIDRLFSLLDPSYFKVKDFVSLLK